MRASLVGLWLSVFLVAGAGSAFCQVIVQPNGSGKSVPADATAGQFQQQVSSSGPFDYLLLVFKNAQLKFVSSGTVCTSGPSVNVQVNVPFTSFGLTAGDSLIFAFAVQHRGADTSRSTVLSVIPVVPPTCPAPPTTTKADRLQVARIEEA